MRERGIFSMKYFEYLLSYLEMLAGGRCGGEGGCVYRGVSQHNNNIPRLLCFLFTVPWAILTHCRPVLVIIAGVTN